MLANIGAFMSSGENIAFFVFALLAIGGAIFMLSFTKVVHMVVALALTFISMAGLYVILDAEFVAFVQVLIYAGAISILMIFGIMMTKHQGEEEEPKRPVYNTLLFIGAAGLFGIIFYVIQTATLPTGEFKAPEDNTMEIGKLLFNQHVIPFELMSVLLTVAFIGAIVIAKREED
ncbi:MULTISPECIES: NADH-quinone oxidoreductase subunit J [Paenibacillus]|uniref:NADH-quinone oxidoreductase subunit J n=1 Tax=Paenibacillus radicis (ex Xue et al. 2023) TaxID=2972489 RepID=A0ABT1YGM9_9BACL|nr:NADH-quinone oxidoreductase subunit J [Paenibacillus radicis (ex Xue et al. 2023)]MCR8632331.1 NADH-quinone oxidoreductase subunit J [Paenibacillus radicis (ex Xue et al. 2023)]